MMLVTEVVERVSLCKCKPTVRGPHCTTACQAPRTRTNFIGQYSTVAQLLASHQSDPCSIPARVTPDFCMWESCWTMPLAGGFPRGSAISIALYFWRCSIHTSITLIGSEDLDGWTSIIYEKSAVLFGIGNLPFNFSDVDFHTIVGTGVVICTNPWSLPDFHMWGSCRAMHAAGRRVFSGIYRFPHQCLPPLLHTHLTSPSSSLKTSLLRAALISPLS
ncbi:hypothetical protein PR048_007375 [Dryococelus australis]|uniref:Uncharacterized protein n=1 Tax=Dryococelus australis TaxID=614101 RepID=A0ABQ9HU68_9NEOP|nr:hypothetical protein PR048_007375 [Dryococelus australis]